MYACAIKGLQYTNSLRIKGSDVASEYGDEGMYVQWKLYNADTLGTTKCVLNTEVS
jgi:hypothetical protein